MAHLALMAPKGNGVSGGSWVELTPSMLGREKYENRSGCSYFIAVEADAGSFCIGQAAQQSLVIMRHPTGISLCIAGST